MITTGSFSGHFDLRVYDAATGRLTKSRSFPNLITNDGLIRYCSGNTFNSVRISVGTGTAEPLPTDTGLSNFLRSSNATNQLLGNASTPQPPDYLSTTKMTIRFQAGEFHGDNISEIGVCVAGTVNVNNAHWCRALILDEYGNPSSITVLENEYLDVTYTLIYHPNLDDTQFTFEMDGVTYECTARVAYVGSGVFNNSGYGHALSRGPLFISRVYNSQTLGEITGQPIYSSGGMKEVYYDNNNIQYASERPYSHTSTFTLGLSAGNFDGGIGAMLLATNLYRAYGIMNQTQVSINPKIPKDANTEMTFTLMKSVSRWPTM